jgi:Ran GTPase-activating protein (RanGAP) involved in mRNA processing and transport
VKLYIFPFHRSETEMRTCSSSSKSSQLTSKRFLSPCIAARRLLLSWAVKKSPSTRATPQDRPTAIQLRVLTYNLICHLKLALLAIVLIIIIFIIMADDNVVSSSTRNIDPIILRAVGAIDIQGSSRADHQELKIENLPSLDGDNAQFIVNYLLQHANSVNRLYIGCHEWSVQAVEIFRSYFSTTTCTLRFINLHRGRLGNANCGRLLSGLHGNTSVVQLHLRYDIGLQGAAGGGHLSALLQNNSHLRELRCGSMSLGAPGARALSASLRSSHSLRALLLRKCSLGDAGTAVLARALEDNRTIHVLSLESNNMTSQSLVHVIRLLKHESLRLLTLDQNPNLFSSRSPTTLFTNALRSSAWEIKLKILSMNLCQLPSQVITALFSAAAGAAVDDTPSIYELNVYDRNQIHGQALVQILQLVPRMTSLRRLHVNLDFAGASVQSSFHSNTSVTHLYSGVDRVKIKRQYHRHDNSQHNAVEPLLRILKRNQKLHNANGLLQGTNRKGVWVAGLTCLAQDHTGASAVYKIMRAKLVMWWAPPQSVLSTTYSI